MACMLFPGFGRSSFCLALVVEVLERGSCTEGITFLISEGLRWALSISSHTTWLMKGKNSRVEPIAVGNVASLLWR